MPTYLRPGVYVEEIPSGAKPIEAVGTSTAAFIGFTGKGPIGQPTLIFKWDDYQQRFGGVRDTGKSPAGDAMGHSVAAFFRNGGTAAYIVRLAAGAGKAQGFLLNPGDPSNQLIRFSAVNEGAWGNALRVRVSEKAVPGGSTYGLSIGTGDGNDYAELESFSGLSLVDSDPAYLEGAVNGVSSLVAASVQNLSPFQLGTSTSGDLTGLNPAALLNKTFTVTVDGTARPVTFATGDLSGTSTLADIAAKIQEKVRGASSKPEVTAFTAQAVGSTLVLTSGSRKATSAVVVTGPGDASDATALLKLGAAREGVERSGQQAVGALVAAANAPVVLAGGGDGGAPVQADYDQALASLVKIRGINILALPGQAWDTAGKPAVQAAVAHAEATRNRMVLIDPPRGAELVDADDVSGLGLPTSTYTTLYYPWVRVANPFYNAEKNPGVPVTVLVPPSGFAAGMWAKIDGRRGVWKAPAGVETALLGLAGTEFQVQDGEQDQLNPLGVNCLRTLPNFGPVIWGTRTLSTKADPEWRYVPVRRTAMFIEESLYGGMQWAVFEPNDHRLWSALRTNIDSFMNGLFRAGAFQGEKSSDAYFVRCGLGDTMTQGDVDRGQVIAIVAFAPLKPAEFVIIRIQQKVGQ